MNDTAHSKREWLCRFADQMVESTDYEMGLAEAVRLGKAEYERWGAMRPEAVVKRLIRTCEHQRATLAWVPHATVAQRATRSLHAR